MIYMIYPVFHFAGENRIFVMYFSCYDTPFAISYLESDE